MMDKKHLFDDKKNVNRVIHLLWGCCGLLLVLDFILQRHVYHPLENLPGFYPLYGFIGCVLLVVIAKWMRSLIMRSESYYQQNALDNDTHHKDRQDHVDD